MPTLIKRDSVFKVALYTTLLERKRYRHTKKWFSCTSVKTGNFRDNPKEIRVLKEYFFNLKIIFKLHARVLIKISWEN